jgi:hypothetical protein
MPRYAPIVENMQRAAKRARRRELNKAAIPLTAQNTGLFEDVEVLRYCSSEIEKGAATGQKCTGSRFVNTSKCSFASRRRLHTRSVERDERDALPKEPEPAPAIGLGHG